MKVRPYVKIMDMKKAQDRVKQGSSLQLLRMHVEGKFLNAIASVHVNIWPVKGQKRGENEFIINGHEPQRIKMKKREIKEW